MRHIDWFGLVTVVTTVFVHSSLEVAAGVQTASARMHPDASLIAENPPKEFDFKNPTFWADQCRSLYSEKLYPEALAACRRNLHNPDEAMQSLQVKGKADQRPLTFNVFQASQRELTKANRLLDDANYWLNRTFSQAIERLAFISFKLIEPI